MALAGRCLIFAAGCFVGGFVVRLIGQSPGLVEKAQLTAPGTTRMADIENEHMAPGVTFEKTQPKSLSTSSIKQMGHPVPARLVDIENEHVDTSDMEKAQLIVPGTNEEVAIFIYKDADHIDKKISKNIKLLHTYEPKSVQMLLDVWKAGSKGGNYLDVGGNIGGFALPIARSILRYGGQVVAIEGMPSIAAHFKAGVVANKLDNIALYQYAVSGPDEGNSIEMILQPSNKGSSSVVGNKGGRSDRLGRQQTVGLTTIDAILSIEPALQKVLVMKMDVEGNEGRALKGARELLAKYPPCYLLMELDLKWLNNAGTPWASVKQQLDDAGYDTSPPAPSHRDNYFVAQRDLQQCLARCGS